MWFKIDLSGIVLQIQIRGYEKSSEGLWDSQWCKTDYSFSSDPWLNYHKENDEVLLSCEIENLANSIEKLLNDELNEVTTIDFIEPDFHFILHPKRDLRNDPKYIYIAPGHEIADIYMEWTVSFWCDGLTDNYLSVTLDRYEMEFFKNYLYFVIGKQKLDSPELIQMQNYGMLYGD